MAASTNIPGWNTLEVIVRGDRATHIVNGVVNMRVSDMKSWDAASNSWVKLDHGRIALQAESAEALLSQHPHPPADRMRTTCRPAPKATEVWFPVPAKVTPGATPGAPPSDAIVLFDGKNLDAWQSANGGAPARWSVVNGEMVVAPGTGDIQTKAGFGDVQLHIEWCGPALPADKVNQDRANSGVFLQDIYEVQVLDNFENPTYVNGMVGSIYKQFPPLVNATLPAETWNVYDIIFTAPRFNADGSLASPARLTVLHNGVLVQNNASLKGGTTYIGAPSYHRARRRAAAAAGSRTPGAFPEHLAAKAVALAPLLDPADGAAEFEFGGLARGVIDPWVAVARVPAQVSARTAADPPACASSSRATDFRSDAVRVR